MSYNQNHKKRGTHYVAKTTLPNLKRRLSALHEEEGRTYKSITAEYGVSKASISKWCREFSKECQTDP